MPQTPHKTSNSKPEHEGGTNNTNKHDASKNHLQVKPGSSPSNKHPKPLLTGKTDASRKVGMGYKGSTSSPHIHDKLGKRKSVLDSFTQGSHTTSAGHSDDPMQVLDPNFEPEPAIEIPTTIQVKGKRAFRRYIRESGIKLGVVRAIVSLYEEPNKPNDALGYICKQMGAGIPSIEDVLALQAKVTDLRAQMDEMEANNEAMRAKLQSRIIASPSEKEVLPEFQDLFNTFVMPSVSFYGLKETPGEVVSGEGEWDEEEEFEDEEGSNENSGNESEEASPEEL